MATVSDVWVESLPAKDSIINGVKYNQHMNFQAPGYQPTLVNLHQILLGYKDKPVNNLRMLLINNKLCPEDIYSYMFDKDYILRVEVINSDEIEDLKNHSCKFSIVRIFTKTKENLEKEKEPKRIR
ncbi:MAG: hypothetical protein LBR66_04315 [Candidatus Symbiothrix sp.]|nr:hypothetical protein [Candidatus Symbiothrix sp.]